MTAVDLYNQPLFVYNTLNPTEAPVPDLGTGYTWSNGGKTLTITTRSGVKWSDGKPFSAGRRRVHLQPDQEASRP